MGVTVPDQPPQMLWPVSEAQDVAPDGSVWGSGGTIAFDAQPRWWMRCGEASVPAAYEVLGYAERSTPLGPVSVPVVRIRPVQMLPERSEVVVVFEHRARGPLEVHRFRTGTSRTRSATSARALDPDALPMAPMAPEPVTPGAGERVAFALELGEGPWVVRTEGARVQTELVVGPGVHRGAVNRHADGALVVTVLDERLEERLRLAL